MIIIVLGLPGTGKSYFAQLLSDRLGAVYINSDRLRNALKARGMYTRKNKLEIYQAMVEEARRTVAEGKNVVIDATFYKRIMTNLFIQLATDHTVPIRFIKIEADEKLIKERLKKPRQDSEADFGVYVKIKEEFEEPVVPHLRLRSEADNIDTMLESALNFLGQCHE